MCKCIYDAYGLYELHRWCFLIHSTPTALHRNHFFFLIEKKKHSSNVCVDTSKNEREMMRIDMGRFALYRIIIIKRSRRFDSLSVSGIFILRVLQGAHRKSNNNNDVNVHEFENDKINHFFSVSHFSGCYVVSTYIHITSTTTRYYIYLLPASCVSVSWPEISMLLRNSHFPFEPIENAACL